MILLIDQLVNPPSSISSIRDLSLFINIFIKTDLLLISNDKDYYYKYMKKWGAFDYFSDIIQYEEIGSGLIISIERERRPNIIIDKISAENMNKLLFDIKKYNC